MLKEKIRRKNLEYMLYKILEDESFSTFHDTQKEVLYYIVLGYTDSEIKEETGYDQESLDILRERFYTKFKVSSDHKLSLKIFERLLINSIN